jgi:hypothetical protein
VIFRSSETAGPFLVLYLNATSARIPDLPPPGFRLRPGTAHQWVVYKFFPYASLDAKVTRENPASAETGDAPSETYGEPDRGS